MSRPVKVVEAHTELNEAFSKILRLAIHLGLSSTHNKLMEIRTFMSRTIDHDPSKLAMWRKS